MQKIRIRNTDIDINIQDEVFPFIENGVLYLRMVVVNYMDEPIEFLSIMPQDILYRISSYDQEVMDEINDASDQALMEQSRRIAEMEEEGVTEIVDTHDGMHYG